jgi:Aerotolerance regulator N-terminal/von Willebrand factor type A domain/CARDB
MSFLAPLFLIGLAGLAIPVFLHLIQKERKQVVQFPSLMFLRRIPYQSVQRRRIRHWLLLMLRLAALALIVMAFGRPFFRGTDPAAASANGAREVVILLDRSYSMSYGDRWTRAVAAARSAVESLSPSDRGSIVLFGSATDVALRSTSDKGRLLSALAGAKLSSGATHYGPVLKLAGSILSESSLPRREVVLVTDFQRGGWRGADGVRLPDGAVLTPVSISDPETANTSVTPVALERSTFSNQERVTVTAGVANHGSKAIDGVDLTLEVNGRAIQTQRVKVEPNASTSASFAPVTLTASEVRATVKLADDAMTRDNVFHFMVAAPRPVRTLIVNRGGGRDATLYLSRALAVGDAPRFETITREAEGLGADDLQSAAIVVLNDVQVSTGFAERLGKFVEHGGGLLIVAGQRGTWPQERAALVPALAGEAVDRSRGQAGRLVGLEYGHPMFEPFRAPRSGDFSAARFYGYRAMTAQQGGNVLARFDDGTVALVERRVGAGRVMVWGSSLDIEWNDLALKPIFLPFVQQLGRHLAAYREAEPWLTVGEVLDPARTAAAHAADVRTVISPTGQRITLDPEGGDVVPLEEQGFYELRGQSASGGPAATVAANVDLSESDLTPMDPKEVVAAVTGRAASAASSGESVEMTDATRESMQRVWWYLLFAGVLLLAAETFVSNRSAI